MIHGLNCVSSTLRTFNRQFCSDFKLAQQTANYVAETMTPMQHQELEHPDGFLQGSLLSSLFYGPAMNTQRFDLISYYYLFNLSFIADTLVELSASHLTVTQHEFRDVCELCFLSHLDKAFKFKYIHTATDKTQY